MKKSASQNKTENELLISKLSLAIKTKYRNLLASASYTDNSLNSEIKELVTTKYKDSQPKEVFNNIESEILSKIKAKLPKNYRPMRKGKSVEKRRNPRN